MDNSQLIVLGVLSIFIIGGAIGVGTGGRGIWQRISGHESSIVGSIFLLGIGLVFGCAPLAFGFDPHTPDWVLPLQLLLGLAVTITTFSVGQQILAWLTSRTIIFLGLVAFGLMFVCAGGYGAFITLGQGRSTINAVLVGGVFGVIGLAIILLGLINIFKQR